MKMLVNRRKVNRNLNKLKNTFIERVPESKPLTRTMKVFLVTLLALFLMDFGYPHGDRRKILIKKMIILILAMVFCILCTIGICGINLSIFRLTWRIKVIVQHFSFIIILLFANSIQFCRFIEKLHAIDSKIEIRSEKFNLDRKIIGLFIVSTATNIVLVKLNWDHFNSYMNNVALEVPFLMMQIASDVPLIVLFFIYYSVYLRVTMLREFLKRKIFFADKVIGDKTIIVYSHRVYMSLVDLTESIKKTYDYIFLLSVVLNVPNILAVIYSAIKDIKSNSRNAFYAVEFFMVLHIMVMKFAPAYAAGSMSTAAHQIKVLLHDKLIEEKDPEKLDIIWKFLNYIDTRSLRLQVFTVVPLDATLPMKVLDLCCTYVIVLIQLTHLY